MVMLPSKYRWMKRPIIGTYLNSREKSLKELDEVWQKMMFQNLISINIKIDYSYRKFIKVKIILLFTPTG